MSSQKSLATHRAIHSLISRRTGAPVPKLLGEKRPVQSLLFACYRMCQTGLRVLFW